MGLCDSTYRPRAMGAHAPRYRAPMPRAIARHGGPCPALPRAHRPIGPSAHRPMPRAIARPCPALPRAHRPIGPSAHRPIGPSAHRPIGPSAHAPRYRAPMPRATREHTTSTQVKCTFSCNLAFSLRKSRIITRLFYSRPCPALPRAHRPIGPSAHAPRYRAPWGPIGPCPALSRAMGAE
jgi:hypothetical protein